MVKEIPEYALGWVINPSVKETFADDFSEEKARVVLDFHRRLPDYRRTRLVDLRRLAGAFGVDRILVKDESSRFGLQAFKALGSSYAVARLLARELKLPAETMRINDLIDEKARRHLGAMTFTTATDGNHGRGVAWTAQLLGHAAVIYMPKGTARARIENIRALGASVNVTDLNYDHTVRLAGESARRNGWHLIQDTAWDGYTDIPRWIMQGYLTMSAEAVEQMAGLHVHPTHVFVQAGVGSMAAAVVGHLARVYTADPPAFILMEPNRAACFFESAAAGDGKPHTVSGDLDTIMAGLACGAPNPMAWKILKRQTAAYIRCDDYVAANGIRILANPLEGDEGVEAGESAAVGIGLLDLIANEAGLEKLKSALGIGPQSRLLFFSTEGTTDPGSVRDILWHGKFAMPNRHEHKQEKTDDRPFPIRLE
jgi:diaminopropionate ammonia-lyase